ncbi:hypothetical protein KUV89_12045 [Marinobacter hydrocarbonoclasticus]|nr:hypothetical protein [Marinobacter nauticus]
MRRSLVLKVVLAAAALMLSVLPGKPATAGNWGWSVHYGSGYSHYGHYRYGSPYWSSRWRYPWYPSYWNRHDWRNWDHRYRYPYRHSERPAKVVAPKRVPVPVDTTLSQEQTVKGSRGSLPANARLMQTDKGTRYLWEGVCYRYDFPSDRYLAETCP